MWSNWLHVLLVGVQADTTTLKNCVVVSTKTEYIDYTS